MYAIILNGLVWKVERTEADAYVTLWESGRHLTSIWQICYYS